MEANVRNVAELIAKALTEAKLLDDTTETVTAAPTIDKDITEQALEQARKNDRANFNPSNFVMCA